MKIFPETHEFYIRPKGKKATSYWRSVFLGFFYPILTLPKNVITIILLPLAIAVIVAAGRVFTLPLSVLYVMYLGLSGRVQVVDLTKEQGNVVQRISANGNQEEKLKLDEILEADGRLN